jgi:TRAP-type mannitol/chloroaromatic compound transport system permease small subunit
MQKALLWVDKASTLAGQVCSWSIVVLTALISWEVFSRYVLNVPHAWVLDVQIMLYGVLFMMAGAYTLSKEGHVRGDVLYSFFEPRTQAIWDLILYIVFFLPGIFALSYAGWIYANESLAINEKTFSPDPAAAVALQVRDAGRRLRPDAAGHRRDHPLRDLHPRWRMAFARTRRRGSRRREAQGNGPRQGRGHCRPRQVRRRPGTGPPRPMRGPPSENQEGLVFRLLP